jgi:hypothetical protein
MAVGAGSLTLRGWVGASVSSPPAGSVDLARQRAGKRRRRFAARSMDQETAQNENGELPFAAMPGRYQEGTAMPNAVVMTGYGPPEVLKWAGVQLPEPGEGQIRIKVKAAGIGPTDLDLRARPSQGHPAAP